MSNPSCVLRLLKPPKVFERLALELSFVHEKRDIAALIFNRCWSKSRNSASEYGIRDRIGCIDKILFLEPRAVKIIVPPLVQVCIVIVHFKNWPGLVHKPQLKYPELCSIVNVAAIYDKEGFAAKTSVCSILQCAIADIF